MFNYIELVVVILILKEEDKDKLPKILNLRVREA